METGCVKTTWHDEWKARRNRLHKLSRMIINMTQWTKSKKELLTQAQQITKAVWGTQGQQKWFLSGRKTYFCELSHRKTIFPCMFHVSMMWDMRTSDRTQQHLPRWHCSFSLASHWWLSTYAAESRHLLPGETKTSVSTGMQFKRCALLNTASVVFAASTLGI